MTHNLREVEARECTRCGDVFTPKAGGYNALYCSQHCKDSSKRERVKNNTPYLLKARRKRHYEKMKKDPVRIAKHKKRSNKYREETRQWLANYKMERGCADCGYKGHFSALQLDHEGEKSVSISEARSSVKRLKTEIETGKCVVRCANCHAIKTWERKKGAIDG